MNWPLVKLSDICEINIGKTPSRANSNYWGKGNPWLSIRDMNQGVKLYNTKEEITDIGVKESNIKLVPNGTVLFSFKLSIGKIGITQRDMYTNEAIAALPVKNRKVIFENYLAYALSNIKLGKTTDRAVMGAILNKEKLKEIKIPLPPLEVQKRIAAVLDKADAVRRKRQQAIELSEQLLRSVFLDMFGDPVTNPKGYKIGKIGDLLSSINYGTSAKAGEKGKYPILRMNNITYEGDWNLESLKYIDMTEKERQKYTADPGDILFNRTNSKELVGKTAVFRETKPYIFAGYLIRSKTNSLAEPDYISGFLNSKYGKAILRNMCKSIVGMANINAQEYQSIEILIPPIGEQQKYVKVTKKIREQIICYQQALTKHGELFNSLSQKAFRGELNEQPEKELALRI